MISTIKKHGVSISICIVILILCFMDTGALPKVEMTDFDKLVHLTMFLVVSGSIFLENSNWFQKPVSSQRMFFGSFLFSTLFSGSIELMQEYLTPNRTGDWFDFIYDCIGVVIGIMICLIINRRIQIKANKQ